MQNALASCGGVPDELRTDRLSAACRNRNGSFSADITRRYHALCSHYGLAYSRNNLGVAHENGRVESPHGHLKRRIEQALLLRGSSDFESLAAYQAFLAAVLEQYNRPRLVRLDKRKRRCGHCRAFALPTTTSSSSRCGAPARSRCAGWCIRCRRG